MKRVYFNIKVLKETKNIIEKIRDEYGFSSCNAVIIALINNTKRLKFELRGKYGKSK